MRRALILLAVTVLVAPACTRTAQECGTTSIHDDDPQLYTVVFSNCGDKKKYGVTCTPDTTLPALNMIQCTCSVDGVVGKTFTFSSGLMSDSDTIKPVVNPQCGWHIE